MVTTETLMREHRWVLGTEKAAKSRGSSSHALSTRFVEFESTMIKNNSTGSLNDLVIYFPIKLD